MVCAIGGPTGRERAVVAGSRHALIHWRRARWREPSIVESISGGRDGDAKCKQRARWTGCPLAVRECEWADEQSNATIRCQREREVKATFFWRAEGEKERGDE